MISAKPAADAMSRVIEKIVVASTPAAGPPSRLLGNRVLAGMGVISYGFYLWHVPVLVFLRGHGLLPLDPVLGTLVALGPVIAVSTLSWFALERPIIAWAARRNERSRAQRREAEAERRASGVGVDRRTGRHEVGALRA